MTVFARILRVGEGKKLRALQELVPDVNALADEYAALSDDALKHRTVEFRERLANGEDLNDLLFEAFATVREAARRVIGQYHFDVQIVGGAALHFGWIAEMKTGEGKTLVSTLPAYLNGLAGQGVHLVTVNDYLAQRDAEWMGQIHRWLGLSVGLVIPQVEDFQLRRAAYECDITYGTNTEFGFDYLRDNMRVSRDQMVQRGHGYAIVDEVDSILIDEARTPLIISGPAEDAAKLYYQFAGVARSLVRDEDYEVDEEKRTVAPTEDGIEKVERALAVNNLYDLVAANYVHQLQKALQAKELYKRDKDYIVIDGEVKIVDEFTGRILEGRRWSDGLHQAVEAKERVRIKEENHTWATVTLQNYFRMYDKLAGMTGTAETEASEFASTYELAVVPVPTNRPMIRYDQGDLIYKTEEAKFNAVVTDLSERYERGQPVLVGTASVEKSEHLSRLLDKAGIPHTVLNAKQHAREGAIVAQAGRLHGVTVATNMAGRGVDILLGGNPEGLARAEVLAGGLSMDTDEGQARYAELLPAFKAQCDAEGEKIRELGGLYVLGSERHESRRIDNQLRGRSGRQGDPGESRFYLSLEDELMRLFATGAMNWVMSRALPEDVPIEARMVTKAIERAQNTVEARNAEIRKDVLKYDEVMNEQRKVVYARRMQIVDKAELREETMDLLEAALDGAVDADLPSDDQEDWNLDGLILDVSGYYPTKFVPSDFAQAQDRDQVLDSLLAEAIAYYEEREQSMPGGPETMRQVEREIMLQIIDQRWREHLSEMDYLREGINLRAMGQQDPLVAWQADGYEMFGAMMASVDDDYVRYVMRAQVEVLTQTEEQATDLDRATYLAAADPVTGTASLRQGALPMPVEELLAPANLAGVGAGGAGARRASGDGGLAPGDGAALGASAAGGAARQAPAANIPGGEAIQMPIVKGAHEKLGRNDPCWCGSGKKFKHCHGR